MDPAAHLAHLRADSATLLAAQRADPTAPAWAGLGWNRTELLSHVANVHARIRAQLELGTGERVRFSSLEPTPHDDDLPDRFEAGVVDLIEALRAMDVGATWPTWAGPQPGTFFPRRMAQEMAVHRWDGAGGAIDADLAVDGVSELLELFAPRIPAERLAAALGDGGTVHLHATDVEGEWLVRLAPDGISFERGHAKGDVALRGQASDLLLWAWNRAPVDDRFEVFGDPGLLETWRTTVTF
jgi:uncharacterized protein (TIGR03083 family)